MAVDGKKFEERFAKDWKRSFPNGLVERLYDITRGEKGLATPSDFVCYNYPYIFFIECKAHKGASIPFSDIPQIPRLTPKMGIKGVKAGVVLFLYEKEKVFYIPIETLAQLIEDGQKSVGLKAVEAGYNIIEIPSKMLRTYMESDYNILMEIN